MEKKKKEAVRGKHLQKKDDRKPAAKAAMRRAGRYKAIDTARKQVREAQQSTTPQQEQEPYSATDKVESYTAGAVHEIIHYPSHIRHENNPFHRETNYAAAPTPKARPTHNYTRHEATTPKTPTPKELMGREAVREYRQARAEQDNTVPASAMRNADTPTAEAPAPQSHTHSEAPALKSPTPQARMRREAVKEYQQAWAEQSKNSFHHDTDYAAAPAPRVEKPQTQMLQSFLDGEKEPVRLRQASEAPAVSSIKNEAESIKSRLQPQKREVQESVKSHIIVKGQRQTALPRNTSSTKTVKKQLVKEQGRKAAREKSVKELTTGTVRTGNKVIKALSVAVSRALTPSRETLIYAAGILILVLIPFIVIMGVASMLTSTGKGRDNFVPVSENVEGYRPLIRQYAAEFGIPEYEDLIAAVMMQESGGQTSDPMQCSESGYNTEYPREPGGITDPEYSIKVGVQTLAEVLDMAGVESPVDLDGISLALQGYNYGSGYISWALSNYGGYSELNAIEYSDMMAEQYGWSGYGDKAYVSHVLRYYPIGRSFMSEGDAAIVAVAQTQIGNEGGLKYCEWYGYSYRVEWCAIFVSWCADQCGYLDAGILPKELNVIPYVEWFRERDQWQYNDYEPSPGDLIFYDWESDGLADHVGIVERVANGIVYSIEGNAGDACIENSHVMGDTVIYGFGTPAY